MAGGKGWCLLLAVLAFLLPGRIQAEPMKLQLKNSPEGIRITWEAEESAAAYVIYRDDVEIGSVTQKDFTDTEAVSGKRYAYKAAAVMGGKMSGFSEEAIGCFLKPPKLERIFGTAQEVVLIWTAQEAAEEYIVETARRADFKPHELIRTKETSLTLQPDGTEPLYVRVRSRMKAGKEAVYSAWSGSCVLYPFDPDWTFAACSEIHEGIGVLYRSGSLRRKEKTVCVNAGHGTQGGESVYTLSHPDGSPKVTGGTNQEGAVYSMAVSGGTTMLDGNPEASATLSQALILKEKLLEKGYDVLMVREHEDVRLDNVARTVMASSLADCHIAIHYDSTDSDKGAFAIIPSSLASYRSMYPVSEYAGAHERLGRCLAEGIRSVGGKLLADGLMEMDLTQISYSTIPSVDLEIGDRGSAYDPRTQAENAEGILAGIEAFFAGED